MGRPRCDPFDAPAILAALAKGETTPRQAYEAYASEAARPYARSTFESLLRRPLRQPNATGHQSAGPSASAAGVIDDTVADAASDAFWGERLKVKARIVVTTADNACLRGTGGSLIVFDGERSLRYAPGDKHPAAIVMAGWGGLVSIEAVRFCASHRIAIIALNWMRDLLAIMTPGGSASAAILRAQVLVNPAYVARRIVQAKIEEARRTGALPAKEAQKFLAGIECGRSIRDAMTIEAQAARASWAGAPALQWRSGSPRIPLNWKRPWLARINRQPYEASCNAPNQRHAQRRLRRHGRTARGLSHRLGRAAGDRLLTRRQARPVVAGVGRDRTVAAVNRGKCLCLHSPASI
jgi:hypothetical protein